MTNLFTGRKLVIATKHQKEKVIAPVLETAFKVSCFTPEHIDTDIFGTFTGEVERLSDPLVTARKKCYMAMEITGCEMAVASEGSFGSHPEIFFANADDEILVFIDKKNDLEIVARELTINTNFSEQQINSYEQLVEFAKQADFPSHALILKKSKEEKTDIIKGISTWDMLKDSFQLLNQKYKVVYAETDMRAMNNPLRMKAIENAANKLVEKINSCCVNCHTPGFDISEVERGLPCCVCGNGTKSIKSYIYTCVKCSFKEIKLYPLKKTEEDPRYCDFCNP